MHDPKVLFSGYKAPHPLESHVVVRIHTTPGAPPIACRLRGNDAMPDYTPKKALTVALASLAEEFQLLDKRMQVGLRSRVHANHAQQSGLEAAQKPLESNFY